MPTVLFLDPPSDEMLARYPGCRAIGVAGESRSRSPEWMSAHLPAIFAQPVRHWRAGICHYKVCSTFDSSPAFGSIGRALEIGQDVFRHSLGSDRRGGAAFSSAMCFSAIFSQRAEARSIALTGIPTMRHHPVTPMDEGDLRLHLAQQTVRGKSRFWISSLSQAITRRRGWTNFSPKRPAAVLFDGLDEPYA